MKTRRGFTLTEVIIAASFVSVLILLSTSLFVMGSNATKSAATDFDIQSDTRAAAETYSQVIRSATAISTVSRESFTIAHSYNPEWAYIGVEEVRDDSGNRVGDRLISLTPNPANGEPAPYNNHNLKVLVEAKEGYTFKFSLAKEGSDDDNLLRYTIDVFLNDKDMIGTPYFTISTQVDARNAMQITELTGGGESIGAIAFMGEIGNEIITPGSSVAIPTNVVLVLDVSGSMAGTKLTNLKQASIAFCEELLTKGNVNLALVPFHTNVPSLGPATDLQPLTEDTYKRNVTIGTVTSGTVAAGKTIWGSLNALNTSGSTNHVEGLRRAYWSIKNRIDSGAATAGELNYVVVFTDGQPNYITKFLTGGVFTNAYSSTYIDTSKPNVNNVITATSISVSYPTALTGSSSNSATLAKYGDYMNFWVNKSKSDFGNCEFYFVALTSGSVGQISSANLLARRMFLTNGNGSSGNANDYDAPLDTDKYQTTADPTKLTVIFENIAGSIKLDSYSHLEGPND